MFINKAVLLCILCYFLSSCTTSLPDNIVPVDNFQPDRYMGKWYEIARLDHSFERGLSDVSAHYQLLQNGNVEVINRGYNAGKKEWRDITGLAKFIDKSTLGSLKASFFWPFYGGYHIAALDKQDYSWAIVVGPSREYLWILARKKTLPPKLQDQLIKKVSQLDIDTNQLIWVPQERPDA
jgi:apolipoprotein D and lipocalin family protein